MTGKLMAAAAMLLASIVSAQDAPPKVAYARDVKPILDRACASCHSGATAKGEFSIDAKEHFIQGGTTGPAVVVGKADDSYLIQLVEGKVPGLVMPLKGARLPDADVAILRRWVDEGLDWDAVAAAKLAPTARPAAQLAPRRPEIKIKNAIEATANPVDLILAEYYAANQVPAAEPVSDAVYARRVYLDVIGLLPTAAQLKAFEADRRWEKRERLVDELLADRRGYAEHWMSFWNDMLRNDFAGTGYIDGGREQITTWLYQSLANNKPYDQFVRELISPVPGSAGFIKGIVWRGVVNASQTVPLQASQNISQVFLGTNMKCASCHDSFINQWKLTDSYGLASIFTDEPLEIIRCDKPQGKIAQMKFLFPELGAIPSDKPRAERIAELARILTSPEDGRFSRTIVNRLWAALMGRGLVEPLDDMDQPAWDQDLLDWLATDFVDHGWDVKHLMRRILTSQAYQRPTEGLGELTEKAVVFRGPAVRRMSAEQWIDAVSSLTGVWQSSAGALVNYMEGTPEWSAILADSTGSASKAKWIWKGKGAATTAPAGKVYLLRAFKLEGLGDRPVTFARQYTTSDNKFTLYLNGKKVSEGKDFHRAESADLRGGLVEGWNILAAEAENTVESPAGFISLLKLRRGDEVLDIGSDAQWLVSDLKFDGWQKPGFLPLDWPSADELGGVESAPWGLGGNLAGAIAFDTATASTHIRAWQAKADVLMRGLGRPNREQVVTRRATAATTLQALELTNGATVSGILKQGAVNLGIVADAGTEALVRTVYMQGMGREPNEKELEVAAGIVGKPATGEGIEDLLWSLIMLPEFQLIQ